MSPLSAPAGPLPIAIGRSHGGPIARSEAQVLPIAARPEILYHRILADGSQLGIGIRGRGCSRVLRGSRPLRHPHTEARRSASG